MSKTIAYLRVSTDKQDVNNQKLEILEWGRTHSVHIDEFISVAMSSRKTAKKRRIDEVLLLLASGDTLVITELSRLGRSTSEVIDLINELVDRKIYVVILKQNLNIKPDDHDMISKVIITLFALFAELERDLISARTREALAGKKSQGITLGKPKGTVQGSKYDKDKDRIVELLKLGLSVRKIATILGYGKYSHISLGEYINKRGLRKEGNK